MPAQVRRGVSIIPNPVLGGVVRDGLIGVPTHYAALADQGAVYRCSVGPLPPICPDADLSNDIDQDFAKNGINPIKGNGIITVKAGDTSNGVSHIFYIHIGETIRDHEYVTWRQGTSGKVICIHCRGSTIAVQFHDVLLLGEVNLLPGAVVYFQRFIVAGSFNIF